MRLQSRLPLVKWPENALDLIAFGPRLLHVLLGAHSTKLFNLFNYIHMLCYYAICLSAIIQLYSIIYNDVVLSNYIKRGSYCQHQIYIFSIVRVIFPDLVFQLVWLLLTSAILTFSHEGF